LQKKVIPDDKDKMTMSELHKGKQLEEEGKLEEAIAFYRQALVLNINNSWAYHQMGEVLAKQGEFHEAVTAYRHAIQLKPDFSWSYHHLGDALAQQQQWEESATAFSEAIELNPEHYGSYVGLGKSLAKMGQLDEAIAAYLSAKALNPDADWINFSLAEVVEQKKQSDLALAIANRQREIELDPDNLQAYYNFLELQPNNCHVWLQLADILANQYRLEDAIAIYRQVMELIEPKKQTTSNLNSKGDRESALAHYQQENENNQERILDSWKLLEREPEQQKYWLQLADALVKHEQIQEAIAIYGQAFEVDANYSPKNLLNCLKAKTPLRVNAEQLHRFPGQKITTELGANITSLKSNQGWVFYGPYINLSDGLYLVKVDFEFPELISDIQANPEIVGFKFDVVTEGGICVWHECNVYTSQEKLEFILGLVEATNVEFRFGGAGETFSINYIELTLIYEPTSNPAYYSGLGNVLQIKGKQKKASYAHSRAVEMYLSSAKIDHALACYQKALENLQPQHTEAYLELGLNFVQKGLLSEVIACCEGAFDGHHNSAIFYYYNLAILLEKEGFTNEADTLLKAVPPHWQLSDRDICEYIWKGLNQLGPLDENSIYCQTEINPEAVYDNFNQASSYRIIEMEALRGEDIIFMENSGLSVVNLRLMMLDSIALEEFYINSFSEEDNPVKLTRKSTRKNNGKTFTYGDMNDQNNFQQTIVEKKYIYRPCPFSGRILRSNNSKIVWGAIFYRFEAANQIFYLFAHKWSGGLYGVYFPAIETVIKLKIGFEWNTVTLINYLKADTLINWKLIKPYIENTNKKIAGVLGITWANLGHYLWNEVTGIHFLYENDILDKVDKFCVVHNTHDVYKKFNIVDMFTEISSEKLMLFSDSQTCSNFLVENNYLAVRVTDVFIKEELAGRIYSSAKNKCSQTVLNEVENAKQHFPLIWVNLRSHNKSWISQTEGYANIINKLSEDYPKIGVVFDGSPSEEVIMDQIVNLIPSTIATYNAIGDVYESIVWAHAIDTYIAVVGSGLTLVTWIANKPGVAHSETAHLSQQLFWSEVRENAVPPVFIHKDHIVDCGHGKMYCSYDLDWNVLYQEVLKIINGLTETR
jgi:tetratricopeptide (TPR) repeat protein